ncbi:MAG: glycosyltransferase family 4 protein [Candidatus Acidiferrales bacterium]
MTPSEAEVASIAFITCLTLSPIVGAACKRLQLLDHPGPLKIHNRPIPRLGGVAIAISIAAAMLVAGHFELHSSLVVVGFALVWSTGLLDDIRSLPPSVRLISQIVAAFLLWHAGYGFPDVLGEIPGLIATAFAVIVLVNSWNFVDGADGLAAGLAAIAALAFFVASGRAQGSVAATLAVSVAAACGGFLVWNFAPAKLFMGDAGSTLLGFGIAFFALDFYRSNPASSSVALFPIFVAALPVLDAGLAITRRFRHARPVVQGDRCHSYDLLLARGWQSRNVALVFFALASVLSGVGWLALLTRRTMFLLVGALVLAIVFVAAIALGSLGHTESTVHSEARTPEIISSRSSD